MNAQTKFSGQLLRNFQVDYLDKTVEKYVDDYKKLKKEDIGETGWIKIANLINKNIGSEEDFKALESELFDQLAFTLPDDHYIFKLSTEMDIEDTMQYLEERKLPFYNLITSRTDDADSLQIVSVRRTDSEIIFLFRAGFTKDEDDKKTIFFIPCVLDFKNNVFIMKLREVHRRKTAHKVKDLLKEISKWVNELAPSWAIQAYNKKDTKDLYELFKEESDQAEAIIKNHSKNLSDSDLTRMVLEFLENDLEIDDSTLLRLYIERIKSIYYQNEAKDIEDREFKNRFMFAFSFFDGISTKSATRDSERKHVYRKKLYWTLKDLIHEEKKIAEVSMYYKFDPNNFENDNPGKDFWFTEVTFKERYNVYLIEYYSGSRDMDRRKKVSTLFRNLRSIYDSKPSLEALTPFDETYLLLRDFLFDYIDKNADFLDPYDYALKYRKDIMKTLNLFLSLSENNLILIKYYYINCDECGEPTISSSLELAYDCTHCRAPLDLTEEVYSKFKNIHYIFKINRDVRKELIHDLKSQPSFSSKSEEEGIQSSTPKNPSLFDILETEHLKDSALESEKQVMTRLFLSYIEGSP